MKLIKQLNKKIDEWKIMYKIWKKRPKSTFQQVNDIYRKEPILNQAYKDATIMLKRGLFMFNETVNVLFKDQKLYRKGNQNILQIIVEEDMKINKYEQDIRKDILEYLAENSAPNTSSSLILTTVLIDLERLGDYTKDLAKLTLLNPAKLQDNNFTSFIIELKDKVKFMFELTLNSFETKDKAKATQVIEMNKKIREETDKLSLKLDSAKNLRPSQVMVYTLYGRYFRRVSAHLENIATSVVKPFEYIGFGNFKKKKSKKSQIKNTNKTNKKRKNKK